MSEAEQIEVEELPEKERQEQSRFELLLAELSSCLINLPSEQVDGAVEHVQGVMCEALALDRLSLFQCRESGSGLLVLTHLNQRPGLPLPFLKRTDPLFHSTSYWHSGGQETSSGLRRVDCRELCPWIYKQVRQGRTVAVPDVEALGQEAAVDKENLGPCGTRSIVVVPMFVGGAWLGILTFAAGRRRHAWPDVMVKRFQFIADGFANALARSRAEGALRESEARFQQVAENIGDFIWEVDAAGLYTYASGAVERLLGYAPSELVGKLHFYDLFVPDVQDELKATALRVFAEKRSFKGFPNSNVRKDGKVVHLETSGVPIMDAAGNVTGYRGADRDVTERKLAEAALHRSWAEIQRLKDRLQAERDYLRTEIQVTQSFGEIIGQSQAVKRVLHQVERVAPADCPVLITGETGTGKELIARAIHRLSGRRDRALVKVNCAALPSALVESELFGHERGAYTGALASQTGRFEVADGSTIFLDEVGELTPEIQAKLLRVLQEGEFERLGSPKVHKVNVRVIAATNRDLAECVRQRQFRMDLYYRLSVFPIKVPPLRERIEDIALLVSAFVTEFASRMGRRISRLPSRTMEMLQRYSWPGNIRELRNVLEHAVILSNDEVLRVPPLNGAALTASRPTTLAEMEREHILKVFEQTGGRIKGPHGAANLLGMNPGTLYSRMRKLRIPNRRQRDEMQSRS